MMLGLRETPREEGKMEEVFAGSILRAGEGQGQSPVGRGARPRVEGPKGQLLPPSGVPISFLGMPEPLNPRSSGRASGC